MKTIKNWYVLSICENFTLLNIGIINQEQDFATLEHEPADTCMEVKIWEEENYPVTENTDDMAEMK